MSQQQRHQLGLIAVPLTELCLQLQTAEHELLTAWEVFHGACSIVLLSASSLRSLVPGVHDPKSLRKGQRSEQEKALNNREKADVADDVYRVASEKAVQIEAK
jgi:hypothetical protein